MSTDHETPQSALVVEGGAMRSVFSSGLLDGLLRSGFDPFDFFIGSSGGAYNLAAYLAGRPGESLRIYTDYALRPGFISYRRFARGGHLLDLDWLLDTAMADGHLSAAAVASRGKPLVVVLTDVATGAPRFVEATESNLFELLKASAALPLVYRGFPVFEGRRVTDGGVAAGIPVREAIRRGARRILVVRSRPARYVKRDTPAHWLIRWRLRENERLVETMESRVAQFEASLRLIHSPPEGVRVVEVCPPDGFAAGRFARNRAELLRGYEAGTRAARHAISQW